MSVEALPWEIQTRLRDFALGQVHDAQFQHQQLGLPQRVVVGELPAAPVGAEPHHEAIVINAIDRAARLHEVRAGPGGDGDLAVDGDHPR